MKTFLLKLVIFATTCFILLNLVAIFYHATSRGRVEDPGGEIYDAIRKAHLPSSCPQVAIGDSVAHQLLTGYAPPDTLSLATNQAIGVCGQYMLASSAIAHDPALKEITLAYQPSSFTNNLDQKFAFNYFVRPFYPHAEYRAEMSPLVMQRINRRPAARLVLFPLFRYTTLLFDINYETSAPPPDFNYLSPISTEYLEKLSSLCDQHNIRLRVVSTPISSKVSFDKNVFQKEVVDAHLEKLFTGYIDTIRAVDPDLLVDGVHFKDKYIPANSAIFIQMLESRPGH